MKKLFYLVISACLIQLPTLLFAENVGEDSDGTTIDSLEVEYLNWQNLDVKNDKVFGVSIEKAYAELLKNKEPQKKIIVAVIDGGVDINHNDLKGKIWKNSDELPGNGIDDDNNGYVDDVYGWNFIGNSEGENIVEENLEYTRVVRDYQNIYDSLFDPANLLEEQKVSFDLFKACKQEYDSNLDKYTKRKENYANFQERLNKAIQDLKPYTNSDTPRKKDISNIQPKNEAEAKALNFMKTIYKRGFSYEGFNKALEHNSDYIDVRLNLDLNARSIINDDLNDYNDCYYGNNDVIGTRAEHGSFVAGIIAANRNNNLGINGIAENIEIMTLRTVPDGDEYDKDVALSIKYAVDNGANIINMSFGKDFSPQKHLVDKAIKYAEEKGVLLIHAAGNSAEDNDVKTHYPDYVLNDGTSVNNWITVGANGHKKNKHFAAVFSNYGNETVHIFAPGVSMISLYPGNKYDQASGTSFAAPVVTGVAALVWSYYPTLSVNELKNVLLESAFVVDKKVLCPNISSPDKTKIKFSELSSTGGVVNAFNALLLADKKVNEVSQE